MDNDASGLAELDEDILTFDVPDDALEREAAVSDGQAAHTIDATVMASRRTTIFPQSW